MAADVLRRSTQERGELAMGAPFGVRLERLARGEHDRDDGRSEELAERERAPDGEDRDHIDAGLRRR